MGVKQGIGKKRRLATSVYSFSVVHSQWPKPDIGTIATRWSHSTVICPFILFLAHLEVLKIAGLTDFGITML
jgi:hypothetical protein